VHPETPLRGVELAEYFPDLDPAAFMADMDRRGAPLGKRFGGQRLLSNSRHALLGGIHAARQGRADIYDEAVFRAYFTDGADIGDMAVLGSAAAAAGLDKAEFMRAVQDGRYEPVLQEYARQARGQGVRAAPTFFIEGYGKIVGAQPFAVLRDAVVRAAGGTPPPAL